MELTDTIISIMQHLNKLSVSPVEKVPTPQVPQPVHPKRRHKSKIQGIKPDIVIYDDVMTQLAKTELVPYAEAAETFKVVEGVKYRAVPTETVTCSGCAFYPASGECTSELSVIGCLPGSRVDGKSVIWVKDEAEVIENPLAKAYGAYGAAEVAAGIAKMVKAEAAAVEEPVLTVSVGPDPSSGNMVPVIKSKKKTKKPSNEVETIKQLETASVDPANTLLTSTLDTSDIERVVNLFIAANGLLRVDEPTIYLGEEGLDGELRKKLAEAGSLWMGKVPVVFMPGAVGIAILPPDYSKRLQITRTATDESNDPQGVGEHRTR